MANKITTLYSDAAKTNALYPRTKITAISDESGNSLQSMVLYRDNTVPGSGTQDMSALLDLIYPVGSVYISTNNVSPASLWGGVWSAIEGRFLIGADTTYTGGSTGGEAEHTLTADEMPSHNHGVTYKDSNYTAATYSDTISVSGWTNNWRALGSSTTNTGSGQPHNNLPPYLAVYMWERTA